MWLWGALVGCVGIDAPTASPTGQTGATEETGATALMETAALRETAAPTETGAPTETAAPTETGITLDTGGPVLRPNLVFVLLDDVGIERIAAFGMPHDVWPNTPVIDGLAAQGTRFDRAYAMPTCSPTRFNVLTGRHGRRRGLGAPLVGGEPWEMPADELTLPQVLATAGYTSAIAGKWHLSDLNNDGPELPLVAGFQHHRGSMGNIGYNSPWSGSEDGVATTFNVYPTIQTTDSAIEYATTLPEPWFVWVAYNAAHRPVHVPPAGLNPSGVVGSSTQLQKFHALIESVDLELGRLVAALDFEDTTLVLLGDNGTYTDYLPQTGWEPRLGKGAEYEAGVRVPMLVVGAGVLSGTVSTARVQTVDLFPTFMELAGIDPEDRTVSTVGHWDDVVANPFSTPWLDAWTGSSPPVVLDGRSIVPQLRDPALPNARRYLWSERFTPNISPAPSEQWRAVSDERFKYRYRTNSAPPTEELYDLQGRHDDGPNLMLGPLDPVQQAAYDRLVQVMQAHLDELGPSVTAP